MSTQEFGSNVSETFNTEKTHMQFSHELLQQRINAMFKIIFILMLLFLAHASLTTLSHIFFNQFITEHRDTLSSTKTLRDKVLVSFTHIKEWQIKDDTIYYCWSLLFRYLWANHSWSLPLRYLWASHSCPSVRMYSPTLLFFFASEY